jgi:hypothetical protein
MTGRSPPWELSEMGKYCGSRERSNPDDAREEVIPTGSKAVREEEDGIGSGSLKDRPIFFARTVFITYDFGFTDIVREGDEPADFLDVRKKTLVF